ncbi:MAG: hypothetical protein WCC94_00150 [Candidatus Bathyarchaeia archaeon]
MPKEVAKGLMKDNSAREIFKDVQANIERALKTQLTVVVCGPAKASAPKSRGHLREAVRRSLKTDQVIFLEELLASPEGQEVMTLLKEKLQRPLELDQIEILILKANTIDKDVHIVEGAGAIAELVKFEADNDVSKKIYAFVNERYRNKRSFLEQSVFTRLIRAERLYWFKNETDLKSKVKSALNPNRISKSGIL